MNLDFTPRLRIAGIVRQTADYVSVQRGWANRSLWIFVNDPQFVGVLNATEYGTICAVGFLDGPASDPGYFELYGDSIPAEEAFNYAYGRADAVRVEFERRPRWPGRDLLRHRMLPIAGKSTFIGTPRRNHHSWWDVHSLIAAQTMRGVLDGYMRIAELTGGLVAVDIEQPNFLSSTFGVDMPLDRHQRELLVHDLLGDFQRPRNPPFDAVVLEHKTAGLDLAMIAMLCRRNYT